MAYLLPLNNLLSLIPSHLLLVNSSGVQSTAKRVDDEPLTRDAHTVLDMTETSEVDSHSIDPPPPFHSSRTSRPPNRYSFPIILLASLNSISVVHYYMYNMKQVVG